MTQAKQDIAEQLRTVLRYEEKRMGAVSAGMMRQAIAALDDHEIKKMRDAIENLEVQAVRGMVAGWVCIPEVEWDSVMHNAVIQGPRSGPAGMEG